MLALLLDYWLDLLVAELGSMSVWELVLLLVHLSAVLELVSVYSLDLFNIKKIKNVT